MSTCNPTVQVTFKAGEKTQTMQVTLDVVTEKLVGNIPTESVILMRHCILDDGSWEYDHHSMRGRMHITVEPLIHADS